MKAKMTFKKFLQTCFYIYRKMSINIAPSKTNESLTKPNIN